MRAAIALAVAATFASAPPASARPKAEQVYDNDGRVGAYPVGKDRGAHAARRHYRGAAASDHVGSARVRLDATIIGGRPGTPMPPFGSIVTESEAEWIVDQLMRGFPPDAGLPQARSMN